MLFRDRFIESILNLGHEILSRSISMFHFSILNWMVVMHNYFNNRLKSTWLRIKNVTITI